jgi:hypothetical protein
MLTVTTCRNLGILVVLATDHPITDYDISNTNHRYNEISKIELWFSYCQD